ncbi:unnamed protein product [Lactuca saligna]|uniref:Uncharacterized protein n=1 Tax=Lactuca saligna TaxID=75948 RepID=A0AA35VIV1_LACSI|nr:unnamed protein product [Lactuca saligna]
MLCPALGGNVWMLGRSTYFKVIGPDDIGLAGPISETWVLPSNIPSPLRPSSQPDPMQTDFQDGLHQDIATIQQTMTGLRFDYQLYSTQVSEYRDEVLG